MTTIAGPVMIERYQERIRRLEWAVRTLGQAYRDEAYAEIKIQHSRDAMTQAWPNDG